MDAFSPRGSRLAAMIDRHVGDRIRRRRLLMGYTQEQLAEALDISYQQVQKYETGSNRVSAGRLFQIAQRLETSVSYFFEGLDGSRDEAAVPTARPSIEFVRNFNGVQDPGVRTALTQLVRAISDMQAGEGEVPDEEGFGEPAYRSNGHSNGHTNGHANGSGSNGHGAAED